MKEFPLTQIGPRRRRPPHHPPYQLRRRSQPDLAVRKQFSGLAARDFERRQIIASPRSIWCPRWTSSGCEPSRNALSFQFLTPYMWMRRLCGPNQTGPDVCGPTRNYTPSPVAKLLRKTLCICVSVCVCVLWRVGVLYIFPSLRSIYGFWIMLIWVLFVFVTRVVYNLSCINP